MADLLAQRGPEALVGLVGLVVKEAVAAGNAVGGMVARKDRPAQKDQTEREARLARPA